MARGLILAGQMYWGVGLFFSIWFLARVRDDPEYYSFRVVSPWTLFWIGMLIWPFLMIIFALEDEDKDRRG